jgi:valine dehydrogenase (NAD+)
MATQTDSSGTFGDVGLLSRIATHEEVGAIWKRRSGLRAIIAIHSTALGPALGGTRFRAYASMDEALRDVLRLSKAMSYKAAVAGLDLGGGKAVIVGDPGKVKSDELLIDYARFVESFEGRYLTAEDVGTTQADLDLIGEHTRYATGRSASLGGSGDPSPLTAYGVVRAMEAAAEAIFGTASLAGRHVAVNGVGKVGHDVAVLCAERGARITVADISPQAVASVLDQTSAEVATPAEIHTTECDIYAPCALGGALSARTVPELGCRVVCGAANNQLDTPDVDEALQARGIAYVPDYVANAGGIINIAYEQGGYNPAAAKRHVGRIYDTTKTLFEQAHRTGETLSALADRMAEARMSTTSSGSRLKTSEVPPQPA